MGGSSARCSSSHWAYVGGATLPRVLGQLLHALLAHLALQNQADVSFRQVAARAQSTFAAADGLHCRLTHWVENRYETHALPVGSQRVPGGAAASKTACWWRRERFIPNHGWILELFDRAVLSNNHEMLIQFSHFLSILASTFRGFFDCLSSAGFFCKNPRRRPRFCST